MKIFKNNRKCSKTLLFSAATLITFLALKILKFGSLYFWRSCRELNFLSKDTNPKSIGIWRRNLESKYETDAEDNTSSASSFKIQIGINTKFVQAYLIGLSPPFTLEESF